MQDTKDSVIKSLDGQCLEIYNYLPYLLQDLWEMGSSADVITQVIENNNLGSILTPMKVLDVGCGKGPVSISIAKKFSAKVTGVDAMPAFITEASQKAVEMDADTHCSFMVADIRVILPELKGYNLIIVGSIGPILGNVEETLLKLSTCLSNPGYIILDDAYIPAGNSYSDIPCLNELEYFRQLDRSGFKIIDKIIHTSDDMKNNDDEAYRKIDNRAKELINKYPEKIELFEGYLKQQRDENDVIENKINNITLLLKKI